MPQYQGVWTLEQQAQAQSNQQWVTDPNFKNTTLLLQADGTGSGSQNQTFLDGSTNNFFITRNGNTTQGSFSPFSQAPGYWGNYFNGSSWISVPDSTDLDLASGTSWTMEAWVYNTGSSGVQNIMGSQNSAGDVNFLIGIGASNELKAVWCNNTPTAYTVSAPTAITRNTWIHVAAVNNAGTLSLYVNGTSVGTPQSISGSFRNLSSVVAVGRSGDYASQYWVGYISNARIVNGTALYTSNFTPSTTPFTDVANTKLLTCQSNRFVDTNTQVTAKTITIGGTPSVQAFGPFAPALQWTPDVVGGSGYFDGTGDYLSLASVTALQPAASDYTMEVWIYTSSTTNQVFYANEASGALGFQFAVETNQTITMALSSNGTAYGLVLSSTGLLKLGQWNHIAAVRSGSGTNNIAIYLNGVRDATGTFAGTVNAPATTFQVGCRYASGATVPLNGYMGGIRFIKGQALYTASTITIPTGPFTTTGYGSTSQSITGAVNLLINYTNAGIYDGKMAMNLETVSTAQVATAPVKYGSGSMKFNGTSDYLVSFNNVPMGTGDCTIEAWVYPTYTGSGVYAIFTTGPGGTTGNLRFGVNASALYLDIIGASVFSGTGPTIPTNVWVHMAVTRANGIWRGFINGVLMGSTSTQGTTSIVGTERYVGLLGSTGAAGGVPGGWWSGYIDDLRVTQGVARYIANFTPPQQALPRQ